MTLWTLLPFTVSKLKLASSCLLDSADTINSIPTKTLPQHSQATKTVKFEPQLPCKCIQANI